MLKKITLFLIFLTALTSLSIAQELPNLPPSIKWQQINSEHFKIIYPKELEAEAQRTTNILENLYGSASQSLGTQPRKFPVILQNQFAVSNGFVTIAPYHAEFYMFEPQSYRHQGNDRWLERLAVHEFRHMVQFEKAITPFNKILYFLMGEFGPFFSSAAAAPQWFFEGDAVGVETAMGRTGRGRTPSFTMAYKANLMEKGGFNYYKQYLKSFRDLVPNHYLTGYLMTTHLKNKSGVDVWDRILNRSFRRPYIPFTFSIAMKKESGKYLVDTFDEMQVQQKELYTQQLASISPTSFTIPTHNSNKKFTNYYFPNRVFNQNILVVKTGFSDIPSFVIIDKFGNEENILKLGSWQNPDGLSANDSLVVWAEQEFDPRWQRRTYSVIKKLNLKNGKLTRLTKKSKYQAPAISNHGKWVAAIHQSELGQYQVHLLEAQSGKLITAYSNEINARYAIPQFDRTDENLILIKNVDQGKAIVKKNLQNQQEEVLYFSDTENLGTPTINGDWLYYASDKNGIDNVYAMNLKSKINYQVTSSIYGAFAPSVSTNQELLYNEYTADGFEIASIKIEPNSWLKADQVADVGINFHKKMVEQEAVDSLLYNYPDSTYESTSYSKLGRAVRPHTWGISAIPQDDNYSFGVFSKDLLQTTTMSANAIYNTNERVWRGEANVSYQAFYPIIDMSVGFGKRAANGILDDGTKISYNWKENAFGLGVRVPFYLTNNKYFKDANIGMSYDYIYAHNYDLPDNIMIAEDEQRLFALSYNASFFRLLRRSLLDVNSRWGQTLDIQYRHTPLGGTLHSEMFSVESNLYFPGIFKHQSLHLRAGYQLENADNYSFSSPIRYTRGYSYTSFDQFVNLSFNYKLPLLYMDWHMGPLLNVQRIYTNVFFDQGIGRFEGQPNELFYSVGAEVSFNFNLFRLLPLIDMGVRFSYLPEVNDQVIEIIFGGIRY